MSKQPRDDGNEPIPVLALRPGGGQQIAIEGSSNRSSQISASVRVVTLFSTVDAFIEIGDSTVEANDITSHFLPAQIPYDISLGAETRSSDNSRYVAVIQSASSGTLHLSERD